MIFALKLCWINDDENISKNGIFPIYDCVKFASNNVVPTSSICH
jgi:hypothetical protein